MSEFEDSQPKTMIAKMGPGTYRVTLADDATRKLDVEAVDQQNRWEAEATGPEGTRHYRLAASEPGGPLYLHERDRADEDWERVGEVTYAEDL